MSRLLLVPFWSKLQLIYQVSVIEKPLKISNAPLDLLRIVTAFADDPNKVQVKSGIVSQVPYAGVACCDECTLCIYFLVEARTTWAWKILLRNKAGNLCECDPCQSWQVLHYFL